MKHLLLLAVALSLSCSICSGDLFPSQAVTQAEQFVLLIDNRDYQSAYKTGSEFLRLLTSERDWTVERRNSEKLLGRILERKLISLKARGTYPGLPDGDYLIVYYEARTEKKAKAAEVLLLGHSGEHWQVCSYQLK